MADPLYCPWFFSAPCLKPEVWAAWAQAILSVAAIFVAAKLQRWQAQDASREKMHSCIELISFATFVASLMERHFEGKKIGGPRVIHAELVQLCRAFDSINYMDIPNRQLAVCVQRAASTANTLRSIQELLLEHKKLDQERSLGIIKKHSAALDSLLGEAMKATGVRPRDLNEQKELPPDVG
ncbi:hypothetical protein OCJ37_14405 [Xanthomonas sp. AM6]|uniref:hypothetical protein n=1 Tax=Xanthomonas sp. AM6 TaxID=2982531 RepID=UPI0021DA0D35|nr:hypothetical protein [Xanthomonas sp. AM6]UYB51178.1 hypothetical protein OCJ37_14405 [Xanthomonas sp. AM6]